MKILAEALKSVYELQVGKVIFMDITKMVEDIDNHDLTNEEKKAKVTSDFKLIGYDIADEIIHIGIYVAKIYLRSIGILP
jgi:hypothetical protein